MKSGQINLFLDLKKPHKNNDGFWGQNSSEQGVSPVTVFLSLVSVVLGLRPSPFQERKALDH